MIWCEQVNADNLRFIPDFIICTGRNVRHKGTEVNVDMSLTLCNFTIVSGVIDKIGPFKLRMLHSRGWTFFRKLAEKSVACVPGSD